MQIRKWLALLVSAALALSLLAGCGNGESVARSLLNLLDGKYANVSVEMDPDLEADLRQAIRKAEAENAGDADAAIRAALETALGSTITFRYLGDGQKGDTAFDLVFYAGSDPDKAAQAAYSQWNLVFANVPADGQYDTALAMVETNSGIWMLVKATVEKAGSRDDGPDDVVVKGTGFTYNVTKNTITMEANSGETNGLQNLLTGQANEAQEITAARNSGFEKITIELAAGSYSVKDTFGDENTPFMGTLKGEDENNKATINITGGNGLFQQIDSKGRVENITFDVRKAITNTYSYSYDNTTTTTAGAVAGQNNGTITNCDVTINGGSITADGDVDGRFYAGGIAGENNGTISGCTVTIDTSGSISGGDYAGGIAGENGGTISSCQVKGSDTSDTDDNPQIHGDKRAGGIAGLNVINTSTIEGTCTVTNVFINARSSATIHAGGIVGTNASGSVSGTCTVKNCKINAQNTGGGLAYAGGIAGYNSGSVSGGEVDVTTVSAKCGAGGLASAGGIVGYNSSLKGVDDSSIDNDTCTITAKAGDKTVSPDETSISGIGATGEGNESDAFAGTKIGYQATT